MFLTYLMLFVALCLSAVAAFYSIVGLAAIFAAAVVPIVIMGSILEAAKLVVTVWLHEYWQQCKLSMKLYLVPAVFVLMVITSMGIFGFLSKAHTDQALISGDVGAKVAIIDEKIKIERENIANAQQVIQQMDAAVTGVIATGDQEIRQRDGSTRIQSAAERSLQIRRSQARDRDALTKQISESQARIVKLQEESAPIRAEIRKVEAEVGPIKYIAALIYGDNPDTNLLEKAVRWVIIILVAVFDPLAIMMLLAATESMKWERETRARRPEKETPDDISTASEPPSAPVMAGPPEQEPDAGPHPDQPPDDHAPDAGQPDTGDNLPVRSDGTDADQPEPDHQSDRLDVRFLDDFHEPDWPDVRNEHVPDQIDTERPGDYRETTKAQDEDEFEGSGLLDTAEDGDIDGRRANIIAEAQYQWQKDHPGQEMKEQWQDYYDHIARHESRRRWRRHNPDSTANQQRSLLQTGKIDRLPWDDWYVDLFSRAEDDFAKGNVLGFGSSFPRDPSRGDLFVRVDSLPTALYKFNGQKWIPADKRLTDRYAYDDQYIDYLITKISSGEYDPELLTDSERSQIEQKLRSNFDV